MSFPRRVSLAFTLMSLAACDDAAPAVPTDAGVDVASSTDVAVDVATVEDDVPPPERFTYVPAGCTHRVTAPVGTTNTFRDDRTTFGASPEPRNVHVSWPADPASTAAFVWSTDPATRASVVQYGTSPTALDQTAVGSVGTAGLMGNQVTVHETHVCGLAPDTTYHYRVGGEGHWSAVQRFKTAPAAGRSDYDVRFVVSGDSRDNATLWAQVQERVMSGMNPPDFELFTGDAVVVGFFQNLWEAWFAGARTAMAAVPFVMAHGNHEGLTVNYLQQFAQPQTGVAAQDELYFSLDYGPVHLVVLNDTPSRSDFEGDLRGTQRAWLRADLERARANRSRVPFIIATHHKPPFASSGSDEIDILAVREAWAPLYDEFGVDLVLNGHEHNFELSREVDGTGREVTGRRGTRYVVTGGAGASLTGGGDRTLRPWGAYFESALHYVEVHATMTRLEVTPRRLDGTVIEAGRVSLAPRAP